MPDQRRKPGRVTLSTLLSGFLAGSVGLIAAPALAQAAEAVTGQPAGSWADLGLAGVAVGLSIWGMRESDKKRIEEAQRYAKDLGEEKDLRIKEEREHSATVERIYKAKSEVYQRMLDQAERIQREYVEFIRLALKQPPPEEGQKP